MKHTFSILVLCGLLAGCGTPAPDIGGIIGGIATNLPAPVVKTNVTTVVTNTVVVTNAPPAVEPIKPAETNTASNELRDDIDIISKLKADIDRDIWDVKASRGGISWKDDGRGGWRKFTGANGKTVNAEAFLFFYKDGKLIGGKFDSVKVGQNSKGFENITVDPSRGLKGRFGVEPDKGTPLYFCISDMDKKRRSRVVKANGTW